MDNLLQSLIQSYNMTKQKPEVEEQEQASPDMSFLDPAGAPKASFMPPQQDAMEALAALPKPSPSPVLNRKPSVASRAPASQEPISPVSTPAEIPKDVGSYGEDLSDEVLAKQMKQRDIIQAVSGLLGGLNQIGAGIAGVKPPENIGAAAVKLMENRVNNTKERRAGKDAELKRKSAMLELDDEGKLRDANSEVSKATREAAQMLGLKVDDKTSAMMLKNVGINLGSLLVAKQNADMRRDQMQILSNERQSKESRLSDQFAQTQVEKYTKMAQGTEEYKDSAKLMTNLDTVRTLLKDAKIHGGQSLAMLGPRVAKGIANEVGVLTEKDVTRYVEDPTLVGKVRDSLLKLKSGKISDVSYDNLMRLTEIMEKRAKENRSIAYQRTATQLSRNAEIPMEKARAYLDPDFNTSSEAQRAPSVASPAQSSDNEMVRVASPTGQIGSIPKQKLEEALKRGFKQI